MARGTNAVCHPADGAPGTVRPTLCGEHFRIAITSFVIQRKGVGDAAPYGVCDRVRFCGAVRYGFPHPLRCMPQGRFRCCM